VALIANADTLQLICILRSTIRYRNVILRQKLSIGLHRAFTSYCANYQDVRFGYVPGVITHQYHGSKENRNYHNITRVIKSYDYNPVTDLTYDSAGLLEPTKFMKSNLSVALYKYFVGRKEDDPMPTV